MNEVLKINTLFVELFDKILVLERKALINEKFKDISMNDMHIISAVGRNKPNNMSKLAAKLNVTVGTLTIAINNLVKKGYVNRFRSEEDKRVVLVKLSQKGIIAYEHHEHFHKDFVQYVIKDMNGEEKQQLTYMLTKMDSFIKEYHIKK